MTLVLQETNRVLKDSGLLVFTYHHSRWEGWRSVLNAVETAGFRIEACHPVKAEMSVATPKHQAKSPINFDIIMVCRKSLLGSVRTGAVRSLTLAPALQRAETQIDRLRTTGWKLSRNDIAVVVMAQVVAEISRHVDNPASESILEKIEGPILEAVDRLQRYMATEEEGSHG